jgi:hypothetical protein
MQQHVSLAETHALPQKRQRGRLGWHPRPGRPGEYDVPSERTFRRLLELACDHWSIENGQYYRRDRTQDEECCSVRETTAARNLSLFQSLAISKEGGCLVTAAFYAL